MPALMAIIGGDSNPLRRELAAVQRMGAQAGVNLQSSLSGGAHAKSGVIAETVVLLRELSRGNFSRVPGSLTLLMQRMGLLNLILKDSTAASHILAEAWQAQSQAASLAAIAAVRKAAASEAALYAEDGETEATLASAVADEEKAASAILAAKATQAKAVAAGESAAAESGAAATSVGAIGLAGAAIIGLAIGAYAAYKLTSSLVSKLSELKAPNVNVDYIPKHLKAINQAAESQKEINKEVQRTLDLYNSVAKAAERERDITKSRFEHQRKMNELLNKHDPQKQAAGELAINKAERDSELQSKDREQFNLEGEAKSKKAQADAIKVSSKESDRNHVEVAKKAAEEAKKYLDDLNAANNGGDGSLKKKIVRGYNAVALTGVSGSDLDAAELANKKEAYRRLAAYKKAVDDEAANDEIRKKRDLLDKDAGESASKAAELAQQIQEQKGINAETDKNEAEESDAKLRSDQRMMHGHVNSLQQVGAYASPAVSSYYAKSLYHLGRIDNAVTKSGAAGGGRSPTAVNFGGRS